MHILLIHKSGLLNLELSNQFKSYYGRKSLQTSDKLLYKQDLYHLEFL